MRGFSYVIPRDYGFAPNPFHGVCTLATCKPEIRERAQPGDWIIGSGSAAYGFSNQIVFVMCVDHKITYDQYWSDENFQMKKPQFNGSLKQAYGDNIYHHENGTWKQEYSHHRRPEGDINFDNLNRDTKSEYVLISNEFYYFGERPLQLSDKTFAQKVIKTKRGYKNVSEQDVNQLVTFLRDNYKKNTIVDYPYLFTKFEVYNGKS